MIIGTSGSSPLLGRGATSVDACSIGLNNNKNTMAINEVCNVPHLTINQMEQVARVMKSIEGLPVGVRSSPITHTIWEDNVKLLSIELGDQWHLRFHNRSNGTTKDLCHGCDMGLVGNLCEMIYVMDAAQGNCEANCRRDFFEVIDYRTPSVDSMDVF